MSTSRSVVPIRDEHVPGSFHRRIFHADHFFSRNVIGRGSFFFPLGLFWLLTHLCAKETRSTYREGRWARRWLELRAPYFVQFSFFFCYFINIIFAHVIDDKPRVLSLPLQHKKQHTILNCACLCESGKDIEKRRVWMQLKLRGLSVLAY